MDKQKLIESQMQWIETQRNRLMQDPEISKYLKAVNEYVQKVQGRELNEHEKRNIAQCLDNARTETVLGSRSRLFEATTEDSISFLGIQLPVIAALLPSLALNEVAITQALDRRIAAVFYLDVKYGSNKGGVAAGTTMLGAKTGHATAKTGRRYAMAAVVEEVLTDASDGKAVYTGTVAYAPGVQLGTIVVKSALGVVLGTDSAVAGVIAKAISAGVTGTIDAAGNYSIDFSAAALGSGLGATIDYNYQYDLPVDSEGNKKGVPEADVSVTQSAVNAIDFPIRAKYSVGASIDLQKAHGINLEDELVKYLGSEVKFTIDQVGLDMIDEAAKSVDSAGTPTIWNARIQTGQEWLWKKWELLDRFEQGSNLIFKKTKRGVATFIVCGNNVARVIRQMPGETFKAAPGMGKTPPTGPMKIGELMGRTVIQNPFKDDNEYTLGFRGDNYLMAGFIYCPYIPLFATPTLITSDLMAQKGFLSSAGFKVINAGLFCAGEIENLGTIVDGYEA
jgi:hypothetical protein